MSFMSFMDTPIRLPGAEADVAQRATYVARIFGVLAWVILISGALAGLGGLVALFQEPGVGFLLLLATAVTTALMWATVSLFTVIAGYIAQKADH